MRVAMAHGFPPRLVVGCRRVPVVPGYQQLRDAANVSHNLGGSAFSRVGDARPTEGSHFRSESLAHNDGLLIVVDNVIYD